MAYPPVDQTDFVHAVNLYIEGLFPVGPARVIEFNDNVVDKAHYVALVLCWVGSTDNAVTKNVYKVWYTAGGVLTKALVAKTEWPAGF